MYTCEICGRLQQPGTKLILKPTLVRKKKYTYYMKKQRRESEGYETIREAKCCPNCEDSVEMKYE